MSLNSRAPRRLKLALVGPYPLPGQSIAGGTERVIDCLAKELSREADVILVVPGGRLNHVDDSRGFPVHYLKGNRMPGFLRYWTSDARAVAHALRNVAPDIAHFHCGAGVARFSEGPRLGTVHGILETDIVEKNRGRTGRALLARLVAVVVAAVERKYRAHLGTEIVISPYMFEVLDDLNALTTYSIPNPVDDEFINAKKPISGRTARSILAVQRIGPLKNTFGLLKAIAAAFRLDTEATFDIVGADGDSTYAQLCRQFVAAQGLQDRVRFHGQLSTEAIIALLDNATCYASMSNQETAPMAVAEALCRGTPVLGPRKFGFTHMISPGFNGFFWGSDDQDPEIIYRALNHKWDNAKIASQAHSVYHPSIVAASTIRVYRDILKRFEITTPRGEEHI